MTTLIERIRHSVIGSRTLISTPFGEKPLIYADYTASGRSLGFIEDIIRDRVLPFYANTHTETSFTGAQTTALREQARSIIRRAVNGSSEDRVIFCGAGATAAINKLIDIMNLRLPDDLSRRYDLAAVIPPQDRPVVFIGPYEHHSNELPWRESIAELVVIPLNGEGQIDARALEAQLLAHAGRAMKIGSFSAASNVTGVKSDVAGISALLKKHGALAFWDYAAAAPYVGIDMNAETPLDAVFISPHKFIGGPGTPGVLVAKQSILQNRVPAVVGGGTVKYVTPVDHRYIEDHERREEGGTPGIVESIRAGLVFRLQQEVGIREIGRLEGEFVERALARFSACPGLTILGERNAPRLSIVSLRFRHGQRDLHYGFVVALLNDLFGIQMRGGCSCAGPYGHNLLGMDMAYSKAIETELDKGNMLFRPGWVRLNFNYFIDEDEFEYLVRAVELVATHGWRLLPYYHADTAAGVWRYQGLHRDLPVSLETLDFSADIPVAPGRVDQAPDLAGLCSTAERELLRENRPGPRAIVTLSEQAECLRWFVLPQEASAELDAATQGVRVLDPQC
ncbi:MAG: aminotransferase class V-fold PLP-dependent enzyme [Halieaceae bacterium]|nr:aminotransferase class V-fold PLP-dependent enzyme [Halieaceae bacterium]